MNNGPETRFSEKEIQAFVNNAQIALCDCINDDRIPAIKYYTDQIVPLFKDSKFSITELACVLVSAAWNLLSEKGKANGQVHCAG